MAGDRLFTRLKKLDAVHGLARRFPGLTAPLRLASYAVYRGLELALGRRHPHQRVVAQARGLARRPVPAVEPAEPRRKVLFFTVRGWYVHAGMEAVLGKALELRGAACSFFLCGGPLDQCDFKPGTDPYVTRPLCWRCTGFARRLYDAFGLRATVLDELVGPEVRRAAAERVRGVDRPGLEALTWRGVRLYPLVQASVQRSLLRGDVPDDPFSERVLRGFLESAVVTWEGARELLDRERPDVVVMTNGLFFAEALMLRLAQERGVRAVTYERGMPLGTALFAHDEPAVRFNLDREWPARRERPLAPGAGERLDRYLAARARGRVGTTDLWPQMEAEQGALARRLGLEPGRPRAVLFTNVLWDSAVFGRDVGFAGMFEWIDDTVRHFAEHPERELVIRIHPSEVRLPMAESRDRVIDRLRSRFPELPPNVRAVAPDDPASSYTLMSLADAALVYTSTIGLEAAVRGLPVVVAGRTHYRGRGFTVDVARRADYGDLVGRSLAAGPLAEGEVELARRYAHLFFLEYMQPFPWLVDTPRAARRLTVDDLAELAPGRDPRLDRICRAILDGEPFFEPAAGAEGG